MTKEEYVKELQKYYDDHKLKEADSYGEGYTDGLAEALDYAIDLAEKLDKPRRVVKLKGIHGLRKYIRLDDEGKVILGLAESDGITGGALTEDEAKKKWPEFENYNNAGLLEFEEVED